MPFYFPFPLGRRSASTVPLGWVPTGSTSHSWGGAFSGVLKVWGVGSHGALRGWADTTENTYPTYVLGVNSTIVANEEFPMYTVEDRPLVVPPDSGYSVP